MVNLLNAGKPSAKAAKMASLSNICRRIHVLKRFNPQQKSFSTAATLAAGKIVRICQMILFSKHSEDVQTFKR